MGRCQMGSASPVHSAGGDHDDDAAIHRCANGLGSARVDDKLRRQERAVEVNGDELDVGGVGHRVVEASLSAGMGATALTVTAGE